VFTIPIVRHVGGAGQTTLGGAAAGARVDVIALVSEFHMPGAEQDDKMSRKKVTAYNWLQPNGPIRMTLKAQMVAG
jgi:hypothetical protein